MHGRSLPRIEPYVPGKQGERRFAWCFTKRQPPRRHIGARRATFRHWWNVVGSRGACWSAASSPPRTSVITLHGWIHATYILNFEYSLRLLFRLACGWTRRACAPCASMDPDIPGHGRALRLLRAFNGAASGGRRSHWLACLRCIVARQGRRVLGSVVK